MHHEKIDLNLYRNYVRIFSFFLKMQPLSVYTEDQTVVSGLSRYQPLGLIQGPRSKQQGDILYLSVIKTKYSLTKKSGLSTK